MKDNIAQNGQGCKPKEEFTGKNLTRFGGAGLVRRFFDKLHIVDHLAGLGYVQAAGGRLQCHGGLPGYALRLDDGDLQAGPHGGT